MIIFDLQCVNDHRFEGWFKNTSEFESQMTNVMIRCPVCGSEQIARLPSVSHLNLSKSIPQPITEAHNKTELPVRDAQAVLRKLHDHVKQHFEDVGDDFTAEAKRMHYGEIEERNIHGHATREEVEELHDEGIVAFPIPELPEKEKLN